VRGSECEGGIAAQSPSCGGGKEEEEGQSEIECTREGCNIMCITYDHYYSCSDAFDFSVSSSAIG